MTVPPKPRRMSEKRYRELYDSTPQVVETDGVRITACGPISAEVIAKSYRAQGRDVTIHPADESE